MIARCRQIDDMLQLTSLDPEKAAEACQRTDARIWLDLEACEPSELEAWLDKLGVRDFSRKLCLEALDRSGFYPFKNEIFLVIRILAKLFNSLRIIPHFLTVYKTFMPSHWKQCAYWLRYR